MSIERPDHESGEKDEKKGAISFSRREALLLAAMAVGTVAMSPASAEAKPDQRKGSSQAGSGTSGRVEQPGEEADPIRWIVEFGGERLAPETGDLSWSEAAAVATEIAREIREGIRDAVGGNLRIVQVSGPDFPPIIRGKSLPREKIFILD